MNNVNINNYILISAAVNEELELLKTKLNNPKDFIIGKRIVTKGKINNKEILLVPTGPGIINTAQALTSVIEQKKPELIIQTGCAGAFAKAGINNGDIAIASCEIDIHSGIEAKNNPAGLPVSSLPFPILSKENINITNKLATDKILSNKAFTILSENMKDNQKIAYGPFITISTITASDARARLLYDCYKPFMESMEGFSSAHIAFLYDIPFIEIRAASNMVGKRDKSKWDLSLAFSQSNIAVLKFINHMDELK